MSLKEGIDKILNSDKTFTEKNKALIALLRSQNNNRGYYEYEYDSNYKIIIQPENKNNEFAIFMEKDTDQKKQPAQKQNVFNLLFIIYCHKIQFIRKLWIMAFLQFTPIFRMLYSAFILFTDKN